MFFIYGLSSLFFLLSAFSSIKTENILWIFMNFSAPYTSFMYNLHKFDLYEKYPEKEISRYDLSEIYDKHLFNDYIVISIMGYMNIENIIIKNIVLISLFIEYYYTKGIVKSKNVSFLIGVLSRFIKMINLYKNGLLSYYTIFYTFINLFNIMNTILIRNKYGYKRENKILNIILTALWHYYMSMVLCNVSQSMFVELKYNRDLQ
jgi:hypothetical protein